MATAEVLEETTNAATGVWPSPACEKSTVSQILGVKVKDGHQILICKHMRLSDARETRRYQECVDDHNRCCGYSGTSTDNIPTTLECLGTGTYDTFITGVLSVIESAGGSQRTTRDMGIRT